MYFVIQKSYSVNDDPHDPGPDIEYHEYMIDDLGSALIIHNKWIHRNYTDDRYYTDPENPYICDEYYFQSDIIDESDPRFPR